MYSILIRACVLSLPPAGARNAAAPPAVSAPRNHGLRLHWIRGAGKRLSARWQRVSDA